MDFRSTVIHAKAIVDGKGTPPLHDAVVVVEGSKIKAVGRSGEIQLPEGSDIRELSFPDGYLLPGLIDVHTHLMFGTVGGWGYGDGPYEKVIDRDSDEIMLMRAAHNCHIHLSAGVTTLRDNGARNQITFNLREAAKQGLVTAPRLLLCGRPVTTTGGHFFWCNEEADGADGVRQAVRRLVKEGADHIKIMASGGGTAITDNSRVSYTVEELRTIVQAAHDLGKLTTAHCISTQSMRNALDAGVDMMEHGRFREMDGSYAFEPRIAERMAEQGMYLSPTIQGGFRQRESLLAKEEQGPLTPEEQRQLDDVSAMCEGRVDYLNKLWTDWGIKVVAGTDAIGLFGDYCLGLEVQVQAGMSNKDVITSATSVAAKAVGLGETIGTIETGKEADLIVVSRDPLKDITALRTMDFVMRGGKIVEPYRSNES